MTSALTSNVHRVTGFELRPFPALLAFAADAGTVLRSLCFSRDRDSQGIETIVLNGGDWARTWMQRVYFDGLHRLGCCGLRAVQHLHPADPRRLRRQVAQDHLPDPRHVQGHPGRLDIHAGIRGPVGPARQQNPSATTPSATGTRLHTAERERATPPPCACPGKGRRARGAWCPCQIRALPAGITDRVGGSRRIRQGLRLLRPSRLYLCRPWAKRSGPWWSRPLAAMFAPCSLGCHGTPR